MSSAGVHHVTAIVGDAQTAVDFYAGLLGLRLVKRTVNQEDVLNYHLFFGNETADPGTVFTVFPFPNEVPGRPGKPQIESVGFVVPPDALDYWRDRLAAATVDVSGPHERFDERAIRFQDPAGTSIELVTGDSPVEPWTGGAVPADVAIRGIRGVTTLPADPYPTASFLETVGFELAGVDGDRVRYRAGPEHREGPASERTAGGRATVVDVLDRDAEFGREGTGTIQHVALRVADTDALYEWHDHFRERDWTVSRVRDRYYFHSLYVRDPGGILFELATEGPGLTVGEDLATLGESLALPDWAERDREMIESQLPPIALPREDESQ